MGNYGDPDSNLRTVTNSDQMRSGRFYDRVISDPDVFADVNASPSIEKHARSFRAWRNSSKRLKNPVFYSW